MAQREQHERVKKMDRWAGKLLGHKAVVVAMLGVIAMASGLAMANLGGGAGGVSFERTDGTGSLVEPGSGDASSGKTSEGLFELRLLPRRGLCRCRWRRCVARCISSPGRRAGGSGDRCRRRAGA